MSRIGRRPISLPEKVEVKYSDRLLEVKGPKGSLNFTIPELVELNIEGATISLVADYKNDSRASCLMGTTYALISNMLTGVTQGFTKQLNLVGVGYRASISGQKVNLELGYSHPILFLLPEGVQGKMSGNSSIILESCDKHLLGQAAANIRRYRMPEPYKGKGVLFEGEVIRRKAGKSGKK